MVCLGSSVCKGKRRNNAGVMQRRADTVDTSSDTEESCLICVAEHARY
jgi:hypothetical protein